MRVISTGPTDNTIVDLLFHVTLNANGEPTATVVQEEARCSG